MSILKIARMGHPILLERSKTLNSSEIASNPELQKLIDDMVETLKDSGGVGLAGPQVYADKRVILAMAPQSDDTSHGNTEFTVLINPELEFRDKEQELGWEGCLSIPGLRGAVPRARKLIYRGFDRTGRSVEAEAEGFFARILQHEVDHLDGILYPMRMTDFRHFGFDEELARIEREAAYETEESIE